MHDHMHCSLRLTVVGLSVALLVLPVAAEGQVFVLALPGSCTGEVTIAFSGATPDASVELYRGSSTGTDTVPSGNCAGTVLGLSNPQLAITVTADGSGGFSTVVTPQLSACGQMLQTVDLTGCAVSNVAGLVSGSPAPLPETGQGEADEPGDDADLKRGVAWPDPRFTNNLDTTVTDHLTGLIWLEIADCTGIKTWSQALDFVSGLADGMCFLTDGSEAGDWRLPNLHELQSLIDYGEDRPALPADHPFGIIPGGDGDAFWSSTTTANTFATNAWYVDIEDGDIHFIAKNTKLFLWPVRGGQ